MRRRPLPGRAPRPPAYPLPPPRPLRPSHPPAPCWTANTPVLAVSEFSSPCPAAAPRRLMDSSIFTARWMERWKRTAFPDRRRLSAASLRSVRCRRAPVRLRSRWSAPRSPPPRRGARCGTNSRRTSAWTHPLTPVVSSTLHDLPLSPPLNCAIIPRNRIRQRL